MPIPEFPIEGKLMEQSGYQEGILNDPTIRSNVDSGEPRARPRFSAVVKTMSGTIVKLSSDEVDDIFDFYDDDCAFGSLPFTWIHPRTGASGTFKWQKRPAITGTTGVLFTMSIEIMQLPS